MSDGHADDVTTPDDTSARLPHRQRSDTARLWLRRIVIGLIVIALLVVVYLMAASFIPRWWAQQVGKQVDGSFTAGTLWGLFYGFVFTFVPILLVWQARQRRRSAGRRSWGSSSLA